MGAPARLRGRRFQASQNKTIPSPTSSSLLQAAAPSGCSLQCPAGAGHGTHWSPPFKGARGDSETHTLPSISASIPNARSSNYLHISRRCNQSPRSNILPRRNPPAHDLSPVLSLPLRHRLYVTANAVASLFHRFSSPHRLIVGADASSVANRSPSGLRANGCSKLLMRRLLLLLCYGRACARDCSGNGLQY